ncbi:M14 family metallopeptidase [Flavitalea sp.]|nr:M14 metallopeptidase family protein [Flavitalea sp.]
MIRIFCLSVLFNIYAYAMLSAQTVPSPKEHFGFNIGDDYKLSTYTQAEAYFKKLAASDRTKLVDIGLTEEGRHQYMMIVSSPANIKKLDHYKEISQKLAHAEDLNDDQAKALAAEGKAVVWIDGGLHATEVVGAHQLIETMYQFVTKNDPETMEILDNAIILFTHANPDGQELVSDWYMRSSDPKKRSYSQLPRLYQKYIGHDNNRDFYMMNMKETQNISRQQYVEWMPQIIYNHHQTGPPGSVLAGPPYRDPFNYVYDPLMVTSLDGVGAAMNNRLSREGKPGYTQRSGSNYSTWWNGGLRTTSYFHNMIGILTEIIGSPTPSTVPLVPARLIPNMATPYPVTPQEWHFRQSIDYSVSLNYAVLNYAVSNRKDLLYGIYHMGKNSIDNGSRDYWGLSPRHIDSINNAFKKDQRNTRAAESGNNSGGIRPGSFDTIPVKYYNIVLKDSTLRDPRGYIVSADQPDFPTAVKFINALIRSGISVNKSTAEFAVQGKKYPAGSFIVKTAQAFRPHVLDMFEPQDHPNDFSYPGGPPIRPYDAAGWTPAYTMGVQFDRILNDFDGPFQKLAYGDLQAPKVQSNVASSAGYLLDARSNNSFIAVNDLLKAGIKVYRLPKGIAGNANAGPGTFFVPSSGKTILQKASADLGIKITGVAKQPADAVKVSQMRIGLWDTYGGSMPSGWVRWLMEQHHFPINLIYANEIDKGNLRDKYDVIVFVTGAIPAPGRGGNASGGFGGGRQPNRAEIPAEYQNTLGRITADTSIPQIKRFLEAGGSVVTIGSSTNLAYHLGVPVRNALTEMNAGQERPLPGEKFYIPGSVLRVSIDSTQSAAWGMSVEADVYFDASPVFKLAPEAVVKGQVKPIAWFSSNKPLRSGWAWGQAYLEDGVAAFVASIGKGKLYAFGPEITFRGQTQGTFKFLFNELYQAGE